MQIEGSEVLKLISTVGQLVCGHGITGTMVSIVAFQAVDWGSIPVCCHFVLRFN